MRLVMCLRAALSALWLCSAACSDSKSSGPRIPDVGTNRGDIGDPCTSDDECRVGLACKMQTCEPRGDLAEGAACMLTAECGEGLYCGHARTCATAGDGTDGASCTSTADCVRGSVCRFEGFSAVCRAAGDVDLTEACERDDQCLAGLSCAMQTCISAPPVDTMGLPFPPSIPVWTGEEC